MLLIMLLVMEHASFAAALPTVPYALLITFAKPAPLDILFNLVLLVRLIVPQLAHLALNLMFVLHVLPQPLVLPYSTANAVSVT